MLKNLRDILLEQTVKHFGEIFLESCQAGPGIFSYMVKKGIYLPPQLFEDILLKSDQTCWPIPHKFIKPCLSNRDALLWTNVDIKTGRLIQRDLVNLSKSKLPLKQLYFMTNMMTKNMVEVLRQCSADLEFLQILCSDRTKCRHDVPGVRAVTFPKLKRLVLNIEIFFPFYYHFFDISQSHHLQELVIFTYNYSAFGRSLEIQERFEHLIKSGSLLKNLKRLAILIPISYEKADISNYRHLRVLVLPLKEIPLTSLYNLCTKMPNLKNLILPLKYPKPTEITFCHSSHSSRTFYEQYVSSYDLESLLLLIEKRPEFFYYIKSIASTLEHLLELVRKSADQVSPQQWSRVEKVILEFIKRYCYAKMKFLISLFKGDIHQLSRDFMMKISDFFVNTPFYSNSFDLANCQELKNFMYSYVTSQPVNTRSLKYLSHLIFCDSVCKDPRIKPKPDIFTMPLMLTFPESLSSSFHLRSFEIKPILEKSMLPKPPTSSGFHVPIFEETPNPVKMQY